MKKFVIAGIGTGVGKTVVSSILVEALQADYWKPIQAGDLDNDDTNKVQNLISSKKSIFHKERFRLNHPMSPHASAALDGVEMKITDFNLPNTTNSLVIELAGGLMVPINSKVLNLDLLQKWNLPVVLVSHNYLGSINHTLLSIELLKNRKLPIHGIIFNGGENKKTEEFILQYSNLKCLGKVPLLHDLNKQSIKDVAKIFLPAFI